MYEHHANIHIAPPPPFQRYYKRLTLARFGELLDASPDEVEDHVCQLVADKGLWVRRRVIILKYYSVYQLVAKYVH